ncbi:MAG: MFS transporter [Euryarchaeota archaeon]|nr:MFS transporter [Euryarchaeota archaeon]
MNTAAFAVCFAAWMMYGVLVAFLVDKGVYGWDKGQMGLLIGIPVLTGSLTRLPLGILTDRYGGRIVFTLLMLAAAVPTYLVSYASTYSHFLLAGLGFGLTGASFAVGVAYTSIWFKKERQGTALGIFGMGNLGTALTSMGAPSILLVLTDGGANLDGWRTLPKLYAAALVVTAILFFLFTSTKKVEQGQNLVQRLAPLKNIRVWRFGLYYFLLFGGFVALSQWLILYYLNVYSMSLTTAGLMAAVFGLTASVARPFGGWLSDRWGPRKLMYISLCSCIILFVLLSMPRMDVYSPGEGIIAYRSGTVTAISADEIVVENQRYALRPPKEKSIEKYEGIFVFPTNYLWHEPVFRVGDEVKRGQLLARGTTHIYFQANVWIFTGFLFFAAIAMGLGMGAVFKHIPNYFPTEVGVVGGIVGVLGGLGGFFGPLIFGYLLQFTGIWTSNWMFLVLVALVSLVWMHLVIQRMMRQAEPVLVRQIEAASTSGGGERAP